MKIAKVSLIVMAALFVIASVPAEEEHGERSGRYIGATASQFASCLTGGADIIGEPLFGMVVGCSRNELQKYGSMGRQIAVNKPAHTVNFTWLDVRGSEGPIPFYEGFVRGVLGDGSGGVQMRLHLGTYWGNQSSTMSLAPLPDGQALVAWGFNQIYSSDTTAFEPYLLRNETSGLADFLGFGGVAGAGMVPDSLWEDYLHGNAGSYYWPKVAYTDVGGTQVGHLIISSNRTDGDNIALYLRRVGNSEWEPALEIGPAGYHRSYIVSSDINSERVGIAFSGGRGDGTPTGAPISRYNDAESGKHDNDIYVMLSDDAGATWGPLQNVTQRPDSSSGGFAPHAKLSAVFDEFGAYHLVWQSTEWVGYENEFNTRSVLHHWDASSQSMRVAADGNWAPTDCLPGFQQLNYDNPQLSSCAGKLYLTFTGFAPLPLGLEDNCDTRAYTGDRVGAANGSLLLCVSNDYGYTWDAPRDLLQTYTADCDALPGTANQDCFSAAWQSTTRYGVDVTGENFIGYTDFTDRLDPAWPDPDEGDHLFSQYIHDYTPGTAALGEGGWTENPVRTFRFGCVDKVSGARVATSIPQGLAVSDSVNYGAPDTEMSWSLENIGDQNINDLSVTVTLSDPPGFATVNGFGSTLNWGNTNSDTGSISLAPATLGYSDTGFATVTVSGSFAESPMTFDFQLLTEPPPCCQLPGDANRDGAVTIGDVTCMITGIFLDGLCSPPFSPCPEVLDADNSGSFNIGDVIHLIAYIFTSGPPPECGSSG